MQTSTMKLVTIVAEAVLEDELLKEVASSGSKGYTLDRVHGEGSRGVRASDWEGKNIKIETLVTQEVADKLLTVLAEKYFPHYAVVAYVKSVEVVRGDKYR